MVRFQRLKRVGQSNMNCAFAAFNAVRHTISQKYSQKHFSAQHVLIDDVESFSLSKWRVLDACYRCGRSCIMEMSWLLLSFTVFSPPAFFHGDIFMLSDHIFHQRSQLRKRSRGRYGEAKKNILIFGKVEEERGENVVRFTFTELRIMTGSEKVFYDKMSWGN